MFKTITLHQDVLCVTVTEDYIFAGIGGYVYIFNQSNLSLKTRLLLFQGQKVHSVKTTLNSNYLYAVGGKQFSILSINQTSKEISIFREIFCSDWIMDCIAIDVNHFALITAHNEVQLWNDFKMIGCSRTEPFILYSCLVLMDGKDIVVFSGSAFSEVIIWMPNFKDIETQPKLHSVEGHRGVIFSITVDDTRQWMSTTSDDRSVRLWHINYTKPNCWRSAVIEPFYILYGHSARVWRSIFIKSYLVSIGEDSLLCIWDLNGKLMVKTQLHGNSGIRAIDHYSGNIFTGGEDGGLLKFKMTDFLNYLVVKEHAVCENIPRKVSFICDDQICCQTDEFVCLIPGNIKLINLTKITTMALSSCLKFMCVGTSEGKFFISNFNKIIHQVNFEVSVLSIIWKSNFILLTTKTKVFLIFTENNYKQIELNLSIKNLIPNCFLVLNNFLFVGDRKGTLTIINLENQTLLNRIVNLHSSITDIVNLTSNEIFTAGKDGLIKKFIFKNNELVFIHNYRLLMDWAERMLVIHNKIYVFGFSSVNLKIWDLFKQEEICSYDCGGGHRSFDFLLLKNTIKFVFIKRKKVLEVEFKLRKVEKIISGLHDKEINCFGVLLKNPLTIITGSEDTKLLINELNNNTFKQLDCIEEHISSIRCLKIINFNDNEKLIFTAGGRDQLNVFLFKDNYVFLKSSNVLSKGSRYMTLDSLKINLTFLIAAGCSDRSIRIFQLKNYELVLVKQYNYTHCILNIKFVNLKNQTFVSSFGTDGRVIFWDLSSDKIVFQSSLHQSGINAVDIKIINENEIIIATGGDDNMLKVTNFKMDDSILTCKEIFANSNLHSCEITGIILQEDLLFSTSIDQRLTVLKVVNGQYIRINQAITTVPDVHGIALLSKSENRIVVCVYGKGVEIIEINLQIGALNLT